MIFNLEAQQQERLGTRYESPNGVSHVNEVHYCDYCKAHTTQAVSYQHTDYTNKAGTMRLVSVQEQHDCLHCENTTNETLKREKIFLRGGAA